MSCFLLFIFCAVTLHSRVPSGGRMDEGNRQTLWEVAEESATTLALSLLGKLRTDRPYNLFGLFKTMKKLWCPIKGIICRDMGLNSSHFSSTARETWKEYWRWSHGISTNMYWYWARYKKISNHRWCNSKKHLSGLKSMMLHGLEEKRRSYNRLELIWWSDWDW